MIEEELRGALDVPAPPPKAQLDDVIRRGRRRLYWVRTAMTLSLVAVVFTASVGSYVLQFSADSSANDIEDCMTQERGRPPVHDFGTVPRMDEKFVQSWFVAAKKTLSTKTVSAEITEMNPNTFWFDVTDSGGTGSVFLSAGQYTGSPESAARASRWQAGGCRPPMVSTLANGTVLQLHVVVEHADLQSQAQTLFVYKPGGRAYRVDQVNYSETRTLPRRAAPPLTMGDLIMLGAAVAEVS